MKQKILYVDDEQVNLYLFNLTFKNYYEILLAESGIQGLATLEENPDVKLVISDMRMPGMNGLEFIETANQTFPNKVYFMLTGFQKTEEIQAALSKNLIQSYFTKPFSKTELLAEIQQVLDPNIQSL